MRRTKAEKGRSPKDLVKALRDEAQSGQLDARFQQQVVDAARFVEELRLSDRVDPEVLHQSVTI